MKVFSVFMGSTKIEFSVIQLHGKYQGLINDIIVCENTDYESVREMILEDLEINHTYRGVLH